MPPEDWITKKLLRVVLAVVYPLVAAACGFCAWLVITLSMPEEQHEVLYGIGTGVLMAAYMYGRTWYDLRKARQKRESALS